MFKTSIVLFCVGCIIATSAVAQLKTVNSIKGESSAMYLLIHPMHEIEATSKEVLYTASLNPDIKSIQSVTAAVDVTSFDSGNSNRDSHAMEVVDAMSFPEVTFASTSIVPQGNSLIVGGKLIFHGVTNDVTATAIPEWGTDKLVVHATMPISLTAFKVERPSLLFIPVQDTLRFTLTAAFPLK
ncbi:MAG: YceI family protein [Bacteroidota bacterium]|jgi:polyisoprenoid-binding protein YceI